MLLKTVYSSNRGATPRLARRLWRSYLTHEPCQRYRTQKAHICTIFATHRTGTDSLIATYSAEQPFCFSTRDADLPTNVTVQPRRLLAQPQDAPAHILSLLRPPPETQRSALSPPELGRLGRPPALCRDAPGHAGETGRRMRPHRRSGTRRGRPAGLGAAAPEADQLAWHRREGRDVARAMPYPPAAERMGSVRFKPV